MLHWRKLRTAIGVLLGKKRHYLSWEAYQQRMTMLELHAWQEATRRQSARNALMTAP